MIDIVTVVFRDELPILKLQAKSIQRYCNNLNVGKIIVVINDDTMSDSDINIKWWGSFQQRVVVVHRSHWPINYAENGWLTQQLLKMLATELCVSKWSVILDAKTLFVKTVPVFDSKPQVGQLDIYPVFKVSQQRVSDLFDIDLKKQLGPGGVPFVFDNQLVQDMIDKVQNLTGQQFADWFQQQGMITEFILYSGYVIYRYGSLANVYNVESSTFVPCNVCHSEVNAFDRKFDEMKNANTVSIHRHAWSQLDAEQQNKYIKFLQSRGIQ
jgi:hypothetical protein